MTLGVAAKPEPQPVERPGGDREVPFAELLVAGGGEVRGGEQDGFGGSEFLGCSDHRRVLPWPKRNKGIQPPFAVGGPTADGPKQIHSCVRKGRPLLATRRR